MSRALRDGVVLGAALLALATTARADGEIARTASAPGARVYLISPQDDAHVTSPVSVRFGLTGMGVAPAGVPSPNTGHHHLVIDAETPALDAALPNDEHNRHFGGGQTELTLELPPGPHTLQLILGDHNHVPHEPPLVSERVAIIVE